MSRWLKTQCENGVQGKRIAGGGGSSDQGSKIVREEILEVVGGEESLFACCFVSAQY